jgi:hypothetical protein
MARNERLVQFGLGDAETVAELAIHWPSGAKSTVRQLPANVTLDVIELRPTAIAWRNGEPPRVIEVECTQTD